MVLNNKTFRVFVSSTFADLKEERNALQREVFPKLRELCMEHGFRFQAIDLRWGVSEEAGLDQQTMKICLEEIERSQRVSPKPNFIVLLGDRYGWEPLPYEIPAEEFEEILTKVSDKDKELLFWNEEWSEEEFSSYEKGWYRKDENADPAVYCLKPRKVDYPKEASSKEIQNIKDKEADKWREKESKLKSILLDAINKLRWAEEDKRHFKYETSATEQEIIKGVLNPPENVKNSEEHVFAFFREIEDADKILYDEHSRYFFDYNDDESCDESSKQKLKELKRKVESKLPSSNVFKYDTEWTGEKITINHLNELCNDVYYSLEKVIQEQIDEYKEKDALDLEIEAHKKFGDDRSKFFIGREENLDKIEEYLENHYSNLCVVYGTSGSGKSALLAKAVKKLCPEFYKNKELYDSLIVRFIGATPESSDIKQLLIGLYKQISKVYGNNNPNIPTEFKDVVNEFNHSLNLAKPDKPLIIFIDALDQLSNSYSAHNLNWLPHHLPENVKIIVSTLPGNTYNSLKNKVADENILKLKPMKMEEGSKLLDLWLANKNRSLNTNQKNGVLEKFDKNGLPLYLKLAFEEAKNWKSYNHDAYIKRDISEIIIQMFDRLSAPENHGKTLVSHVFGYLSASKNGLTEDEILDILAKDKEVFEQTLKYHNPPEEKLPVALWSRLYFDLEPYITEKAADETSLITFYHRQISEIASKYFLTDDVKVKRHNLLADYFQEQELKFKKKDNVIINIRKVSELPYQQTNAKLIDDLFKTLTDLLFIEAKCFAGLVNDLVRDYIRLDLGIQFGPPIITADYYNDKNGIYCPFCKAWFNIEESELGKIINCQYCYNKLKINHFNINKEWKPSEPKNIIKKHFSDEKVGLGKYKDTLSEFAEFIYRQNHILSLFPSILLQQALNEPDSSHIAVQARKVLNKRPDFKWIKYVNKPQIKDFYIFNIFDEDNWFTSSNYLHGGRTIVASSASGHNKILDLKTGEELNEFNIKTYFPLDKVTHSECSPEKTKLLLNSENSFINIFDFDLNEFIFSLPLYYQKKMDFLKYNSHFPIFSKFILWLYGNSTKYELRSIFRHLFRFPKKYYTAKFLNEKNFVAINQSGSFELWNIEKRKKINSLKSLKGYILNISPDGNLLASGLDNKIYLTRLKDHKSTIYVYENSYIIDFKFSPDCKEILIAFGDKTLNIYNIENLESPKFIRSLEGHEEGISFCNYSPDGIKIISGSYSDDMNAEMIIWNAKNGEKLSKTRLNVWTIYDGKFSPDGNYISACSQDKTLKIWDLKYLNHSYINQIDSFFKSIPIKILKISPNGKKIIICLEDGKEIIAPLKDFDLNLSNIQNKKEVIIRENVSSNCYNFTADGNYILIHEGIQIDIKDAKENITIAYTSFDKDKKYFSLSPDGTIIAYYNSPSFPFNPDKFVLRDLRYRKEILEIPIEKDSIYSSFALAPDGKTILISMDNDLYAVNFSHSSDYTRKEFKKSLIHTFPYVINKIVFSNSGRYIVVGNDNNNLVVWDLINNSDIINIQESNNQVFFSHDDESIIFSSFKYLKVLNFTTRKQIANFVSKGDIKTFDVFGSNIIVGDDLGNIYNLEIFGWNNEFAFVTPVKKFILEDIQSYKWDNIKCTCSWCGADINLEEDLINNLKEINANFPKDKSSYLNVPLKYWSKKKFLVTCTSCNKQLRINPYIIDRSD